MHDDPEFPVYSVEIKITEQDYFSVCYMQSPNAPPDIWEFMRFCYKLKNKDGRIVYIIDCDKFIPMIETSYVFNILRKRIQIEITNEWFKRKREAENKE